MQRKTCWKLNLIYDICKQLLIKNDVVLDFGFWTRNERDKVKLLFKNLKVILVYLKLDNEEIFKQVENRNKNLQDNEYFMDRPTFDFLTAKFEEPTNDENPIIYTKQTDLSFLDKE